MSNVAETLSPSTGNGPEDTLTRNALSFDVEDYFHVAALSSVIDREQWDVMERRFEASTRTLLDIVAERDVKATFFILGWVAERCPGLVREIHDQGHEVACHGMSHRLVYEQTPDDFADETRRSKSLLEDITGAPVLGYRAASWSITRDSMWALDTICELGFKYDSSIFPIHHDRYGVPGAEPWPSVVVAPNGQSIAEFPPSTVPLLGTRFPVSGGGYFRLFPYFITKLGLATVANRFKQPFMFYLHPWEVDPEQPRFNASWFSKFRHYNNLRRTEPRLRRLLSDFSFTTVRDVLVQKGLLELEVLPS